MRYPADQKQKTRQRILDAAAVVFRRQGLQAGSVDRVMGEAGLTAGGFYAHFASKEALFSETFTSALREARLVFGEGLQHLSGADRIRAIADKYLSPAHRQMIDQGCPMPPLLAELPRAGEPAQRAFQEILSELIAALEPHLEKDDENTADDKALALLATLVGGMALARAVADEALADRILAACRNQIDASLEPKRTTKPKGKGVRKQ